MWKGPDPNTAGYLNCGDFESLTEFQDIVEEQLDKASWQEVEHGRPLQNPSACSIVNAAERAVVGGCQNI